MRINWLFAFVPPVICREIIRRKKKIASEKQLKFIFLKVTIFNLKKKKEMKKKSALDSRQTFHYNFFLSIHPSINCFHFVLKIDVLNDYFDK